MINKLKNAKLTLEKETKQQGYLCLIVTVVILIIVFWCSKNLNFGKAEIITCVTVIFVLLVCLYVYIFFEIRFYRWCFCFLILTGGLSLLLQPIFNIPDEVAHFARAEIVSEGRLIMDPDENTFDTIQAVEDLKDYFGTSFVHTDLQGKKVDYTPVKVGHAAAINMSFLYFPQAVGILIAKILNLDIIWLLWLGRFMNLCCYCILVSIAIKIAPHWKFVLFFIAALPMSIQQAASVSPDAMINGLSILIIGYFLYLYYRESQEISKREIVIFAIIGILITLAKVTNIFIVGLVLLLPMKNMDKKNSVVVKLLVIVFIAVIGGLYYFYTTTFAPNSEQVSYLIESNVNSKEQIQYILTEPIKWSHDFVSNIVDQFGYFIGLLNQFGWLEYGYPLLTIVSVFGFAKVCFQEQGVKISVLNKFLILLMVMGIYVSSCLALYITWTPVGGDFISGMQGRYLIPMIALCSLLFSSSRVKKKKESYIIDMTMVICMIGAMLVTTAVRYF